jgi:hypothetical protein
MQVYNRKIISCRAGNYKHLEQDPATQNSVVAHVSADGNTFSVKL